MSCSWKTLTIDFTSLGGTLAEDLDCTACKCVSVELGGNTQNRLSGGRQDVVLSLGKGLELGAGLG